MDRSLPRTIMSTYGVDMFVLGRDQSMYAEASITVSTDGRTVPRASEYGVDLVYYSMTLLLHGVGWIAPGDPARYACMEGHRWAITASHHAVSVSYCSTLGIHHATSTWLCRCGRSGWA